MADKDFYSTAVTFVDMADSRILDVYIASNHPTVQLCNSNTTPLEYTPDWSVTNLKLEASFYLDSTAITPETIKWYKRIGTTEDPVGSTATLYVSENVLKDNPIVTYRCEIEYDKLKAFKEITFTRVDTGLNGSNGADAPAVLAQYSADGTTNWTSTLNSTTHKYIRHSYDGGKTWSTAIKMVGEDGTSVRIVGTATSATQVSGTDYYTLVYSSASITSAELGDSYLYDGDLYVCVDSRDGQDYFINVGNIQGPSGNDGKSSYVFIRYATDANGTNMSTSPTGKTYMGVYTSDTNIAPTTANLYTWSKFVGDNAKSIVLSGDSQVFKVSQSNVVTPSIIKVTAQAFNTTATAWTYSTNGGQTFKNDLPAGVSRNGNVVTITGSSIDSNSIVVKVSDGQVEDVFTVYKAFDGINGNPGDPGAPAPIAFLTNENVTFSANAQGQITGTTITSNVVAYNGTTKVLPTVGTITGMPDGMTISKSTITASNEIMLTITITNNSTLGSTSSNNGTITIPVTSPVSTTLKFSWSKVNAGAPGSPGAPGEDAYTVILTNESNVFAGDVSNAIAGTASTQALAYIGSDAQSVTITSVNGVEASTTDTDTGITGLKFKCSALSGTSPTITFTCTTSFKSANGSIPIVLSVDGVSFTKEFTYSIAFKGTQGNPGTPGTPGAPATSYWLVSSANVIQKTSTGTITVTPSTLTFTSKSQTGMATPVDYACRWIMAYSTDGTNYTNLYTSSANEASKSITVATTYKTIRARMYLAGGTTTLLDEQIIPVVADGAPGTPASLVDITPSAYYFKSTTGKDGTFTPEYIYLYPRFQTVTFSKWEYSINGGTSWVAASGANGISIGTYNSIANTLRIARTSTLYTDTITSISFRCVSSDASVYDTVSITKIYDVVDLQIGGRNLAEQTNQGVTNWLWSMQTGDYTKEEYIDSNQVKCCKFTKGTTTTQTGWSVIEYTNIGLLKYEPNQIYTISFDVLSSVATTISVRLLKPDGTNDLASVYTPINKQLTANVWSKIIYTTTTLTTLPALTDQCLYITGMSSSNGVSYVFKNVKIEKGNKATDWSPAPEDVLEYATNTSVMLSNEAHFFEADSRGVPTASSITLDVIGYQGSIQSATTVGTITGLPSAGMTATILNNGATNTQIQIAVTEGLTSVDSGVLTIPVTVNGKVVNKIFSWTKSKEGLMGERGSDAISFQVYSEHGYVLSKDTPSITLQTFAYNGDVPIEAGATYQWYKYSSGNWVAITDATNGYLKISHSDVSFSGSYMCKMLFNNIEYVGVATIDDKNDTNIVFTSKPSSYAAGDIWIVGADYTPSGVTTGTVLRAEYSNNTYDDKDWVTATKYDSVLNDIQKDIDVYNQYFDFDDEEGLKITARDKNNVESKFSTVLTNERLAFNYGDEAIAYINGNSMHIKEAEIESPLTVTGKYSGDTMLQAPIINIGNFSIVVESNGSLSIVSNT